MPGTIFGRWGRHKLLGGSSGDDPDVVRDLNRLVDELEDCPPITFGPLSGRPVSTPGSPGQENRRYHATDIGVEFRDNGTGWDAVGFIVHSGVMTRTTNQTTNNGAATIVSFPNVPREIPSGQVPGTNDRFTVLVGGLYAVAFSATIVTTPANEVSAELYVSPDSYRFDRHVLPAASSDNTVNFSMQFVMAPGTVVMVNVNTAASAAVLSKARLTWCRIAP